MSKVRMLKLIILVFQRSIIVAVRTVPTTTLVPVYIIRVSTVSYVIDYKSGAYIPTDLVT